MLSKRKRKTLLVVSRSRCGDIRLTISIKLVAAGPQYWLSSSPEVVSRLLWPYSGTYRYRLHSRSSKVSNRLSTLLIYSPEAVLVLRSVSSFETLYLTRSTTRINDSVTSAINNYVSSKAPLGPGEGVNIARVITNELDSAKFDPLLVRTVARNGVKVLDSLVSRLDGMVSLFCLFCSVIDNQIVRDFTATSLIGPQATAAQNANAQFASCLYHCWYNLTFVESEFPGKVWEILKPAVNVSRLLAFQYVH